MIGVCVVSGSGGGGHRDRAQPNGIDAEPLKVIEPADDTREIADAVTVRVLERPHIDLVDDAITPPLAGRHFRPSYRASLSARRDNARGLGGEGRRPRSFPRAAEGGKLALILPPGGL